MEGSLCFVPSCQGKGGLWHCVPVERWRILWVITVLEIAIAVAYTRPGPFSLLGGEQRPDRPTGPLDYKCIELALRSSGCQTGVIKLDAHPVQPSCFGVHHRCWQGVGTARHFLCFPSDAVPGPSNLDTRHLLTSV